MGPMQFLPGTWARYASDGNGDGMADPQNLFDATLAAARYLCSGGLNLRDQSQVLSAILRYNNSMPYAQNVLGWAAAYATGVVPVDLPPLTGPPPPLGDAHVEHPEGLGPEPADEHPRPADQRPAGADAADRPQRAAARQCAADVPVDGTGHPQPAPGTLPGCTLICIGSAERRRRRRSIRRRPGRQQPLRRPALGTAARRCRRPRPSAPPPAAAGPPAGRRRPPRQRPPRAAGPPAAAAQGLGRAQARQPGRAGHRRRPVRPADPARPAAADSRARLHSAVMSRR